MFTAYTPPPRTLPMIEARFEEGSGSSVTNSGWAGGIGTIDFGSSVTTLPGFTNNVPAGPYAPADNNYSLSFGAGSGHSQYAGKAVDFPNDVRANTVGLEQFTVAGWINVTDGTIGNGGNRIFTTWPQNVDGIDANRLTGAEVVVAGNGTLRMSVNQAPDYPTPPGNIGPSSSNNRVSLSPNADPANWVFFAVTYDAPGPMDNSKFYFGDGQTPAALDIVSNYNRGAIVDCTAPVTLTLGNFMASAPLASTRDSTSNSRAFRGLMDEIQFFGYALTLEEIQQLQTACNRPRCPSSLEAGQAVITWTSSTLFQLLYKIHWRPATGLRLRKPQTSPATNTPCASPPVPACGSSVCGNDAQRCPSEFRSADTLIRASIRSRCSTARRQAMEARRVGCFRSGRHSFRPLYGRGTPQRGIPHQPPRRFSDLPYRRFPRRQPSARRAHQANWNL